MPKNKILKKKRIQAVLLGQMQEMQETIAHQTEQMLLLTRELRDQQDILKKYYGEYQLLKKRQETQYLMTYIRMRESMRKDMEFYQEHGKMNTRGYSLLEMYVNEYAELLEDAGVEVLECPERTAFDPSTQKPIERVRVARPEFDGVIIRSYGNGYRRDGVMLKKADVAVGVFES